jgi:hypothetical protein
VTYRFKLSKLLLPLLFLNITVAANEWTLFGINIGQIIYWFVIALIWYLATKTIYWKIVTTALWFSVFMRVIQVYLNSEIIIFFKIAALVVLFIIGGLISYGRDPNQLNKQLVLFLSLCVPIMILQILGVSQFVMLWNLDYAHDSSILNSSGILLQPTLFVELEDLIYSISQGRPSGLLANNNILSIFISIAVGINLTLKKSLSLSKSDFIITLAVVLSMSKIVFAITGLLYLSFLLFGWENKRSLILKNIILLVFGMFLYKLLFPGLFSENLNLERFTSSFNGRFFDLLRSTGNLDLFESQQSQLIINSLGEGHYSFIAIFITSKLFIPSLLIIIPILFLYMLRVNKMRSPTVYIVTLLICILTQFAVPYASATSFQFILGFSLFPLFKKIYPQTKEDIRFPNKRGNRFINSTSNQFIKAN